MKKFVRFLLILFLFISLIVIYARYEGTRGLITKEYTIDSSEISEDFDGLKIVHFSDLHYKRIVDKNMVKKIVDEINLINPDIVFFTGDLIDKDFKVNDNDISDLTNLLDSINSKYGKYTIIGNHDYVQDEDVINNIYENSNFIILQNSSDVIYSSNNQKLFIGGLDTFSYDKSDINETMKYFNDNKEDIYKIILVHEPDYTDKILEDYDVNLILSGHSHNGQINIPFVKEFFLPYGSKKYYKNYYNVKDTPLYISSGIGESRINFRLFNRPSINFYRINKITE